MRMRDPTDVRPLSPADSHCVEVLVMGETIGTIGRSAAEGRESKRHRSGAVAWLLLVGIETRGLHQDAVLDTILPMS